MKVSFIHNDACHKKKILCVDRKNKDENKIRGEVIIKGIQ